MVEAVYGHEGNHAWKGNQLPYDFGTYYNLTYGGNGVVIHQLYLLSSAMCAAYSYVMMFYEDGHLYGYFVGTFDS